ncbi:MAG: hypothetical protein GY756_12800 [bacterium]|nr:hypothetical protein [bacterium]
MELIHLMRKVLLYCLFFLSTQIIFSQDKSLRINNNISVSMDSAISFLEEYLDIHFIIDYSIDIKVDKGNCPFIIISYPDNRRTNSDYESFFITRIFYFEGEEPMEIIDHDFHKPVPSDDHIFNDMQSYEYQVLFLNNEDKAPYVIMQVSSRGQAIGIPYVLIDTSFSSKPVSGTAWWDFRADGRKEIFVPLKDSSIPHNTSVYWNDGMTLIEGIEVELSEDEYSEPIEKNYLLQWINNEIVRTYMNKNN